MNPCAVTGSRRFLFAVRRRRRRGSFFFARDVLEQLFGGDFTLAARRQLVRTDNVGGRRGLLLLARLPLATPARTDAPAGRRGLRLLARLVLDRPEQLVGDPLGRGAVGDAVKERAPR